MTARSAYQSLSMGLCPWLRTPLQQLEQARQRGRLAHGWLLTGPEGLGKINLALVAAGRMLNAQASPADTLPPQLGAEAMARRHEPTDHHPDLHWLFPEDDRRTLSVEQIRRAAAALALTSLEGPAKVVVVEPADAMTVAAANALLKTLEEPTPGTYLLLIAHQPGRLPATIRSRCRHLPVPKPATGAALEWLSRFDPELGDAEWGQLLALAEGAPFRAITFHGKDYLKKNNLFEDQFELISRNKLDPQTVADQWLKDDLALALTWLAARLRRAIRLRMAPGESDPVTDPGSDRLRTAWQRLSARALFRRLESTELLLRRLGGGINADLATRALLAGFQGRSARS